MTTATATGKLEIIGDVDGDDEKLRRSQGTDAAACICIYTCNTSRMPHWSTNKINHSPADRDGIALFRLFFFILTL